MLTTSLPLAERYDYLAPKFRQAYQFLRREDLASLAPGIYPIDGEQVYASIQHYTTMPAEDAKFETHNNYIDLQYMIEGRERFGYLPRAALESAPYDAANDLTFHPEPPAGAATFLLLEAGSYAIVPPEDGHKPRCMAGAPMPVKKAVIKIHI